MAQQLIWCLVCNQDQNVISLLYGEDVFSNSQSWRQFASRLFRAAVNSEVTAQALKTDEDDEKSADNLRGLPYVVKRDLPKVLPFVLLAETNLVRYHDLSEVPIQGEGGKLIYNSSPTFEEQYKHLDILVARANFDFVAKCKANKPHSLDCLEGVFKPRKVPDLEQ